MSISGISSLAIDPRLVSTIMAIQSPDPKVQRVLEKFRTEIQNPSTFAQGAVAEPERIYKQINGIWYIGDFSIEEGKGVGIVIRPDGTIEEGDFLNGKLNGQGSRMNHRGICEGKFSDGTFLGKFPRKYPKRKTSDKAPDPTQAPSEDAKALQEQKQFTQSVLRNLSLDLSSENEKRLLKALWEAAEKLKEGTEQLLGRAIERAIYPAVVGRTTLVGHKKGQEFISIANVVSTQEEEKITIIASRAPANFVDADAIVNALKPGDIVINLQEEKEQESASSFYHAIEQRTETIQDPETLPPDDSAKTVLLYRYPHWKDGSAISLEQLDQLVANIDRLVESRQKANLPVRVWVHCYAGIGRTGTLITALRIKQHIASLPDCSNARLETLQEILVRLILDGRSKRSASFVHTEPQFRLLFEYTAKLIGNHASKSSKVPQPLKAIGLLEE